MTDDRDRLLDEWLKTILGKWCLPEVPDSPFKSEPLPGFGSDESAREPAVPVKNLRLLPRMPPGWGPDETVSDSVVRAAQACRTYLATFSKIDVNGPAWLDLAITEIVKNYWADKRYDEQTSLAILKQELILIKRDIETFHSRMSSLSRPLRSNLDQRLKRFTGDGSTCQGIDDIDKLTSALSKVAGRFITEIEPEKVADTAVSTCCASLSALWERAAGKSRLRYAFVERVCEAMNPELTPSQVTWRLKALTQAKSREK